MVTTKPKLKGPPPDMEVPDDIVLKRSGVDPERIGIWCRSHIPCGKKFGPFMGNKVQEATDDMDPTYVWEIVDLSTKEFLFYIDATDEKEGNWMRYINCARFFEEQNIVSEQEGVDIIYRAIKDIYPEQELLTWYEKAPLRKRKGRRIKRAPKAEVTELSPPLSSPSSSLSASKDDSKLNCQAVSILISSYSSKSSQQTSPSMDADLQKNVEGDSSEMHVSQRGRRCKVTKYWEMEADFSDEDSDMEMIVASQDIVKTESSNTVHKAASVGDEEWSVTGADPESHHKPLPHLSIEILGELAKDPREYFQFEMKPCHVVRNHVGRKLFQCDICSSVYRHSFSLKRHYVRNHLNYKFVSPTDLVNCCVPLKSIPPAIQDELRRSVKQEPGSDSLSIGTPRDVAFDDFASEENDVEGGAHDKQSVLTSSPSIGSLVSVNKDDLTEEQANCHSEETSLHSGNNLGDEDMKDIQQEIRDADKVDCYDGDTEIEQNSSDDEDDDHKDGGTLNEITDKEMTNSHVNDQMKSEQPSEHMDVNKKSSEGSISSRLQVKMDTDQCINGKDTPLCVCSADDVVMDSDDLKEDQEKVNKNACASQDKSAERDLEQDGTSVVMATKNEVDSHDHDVDDHSDKKPCFAVLDKETSQCGDESGDGDAESTSCSESVKTTQDGDNMESGHSKQTGIICDTSESKAAHQDIALNGKGEPMYGLYRCNVCEKVFDTIADLKQHLANHPETTDGRQTFACEKCEMKFAHKQNLMRHQAVHTGARPYICSYCDKKFPTSTNLRRHEKVHQARKFSCHHCHSDFTQTGDLKKHIHNVHPELFHECGFCTRYFVKKRLLLDHLKETHDGKTMDDNSIEIEAKQEAFQYGLHLDRAESMRLAITHGKFKPGPRFACTVCRRKFHDYMSMCRHRRLSHQRPIFVAPITDENGDVIDDAVQHYINPCKHGFYDPEDEEQAVFYASIANAIADNLQNCIEGREEHLKEVTPLVKWKNKNGINAMNSKSESDAKSAKVIAESIVYNLQEFNFPKDFKLKSSSNCYRAVPYSSDGRISWKNKKAMSERRRTESISDQGQAKVTSVVKKDGSASSQGSQATSSALLQFLQNDITSMPQTMTSTSILASAELSSPKYSPSSLPPLPPLQKKPKLELTDLQTVGDKRPKLMPIRVPQVKSCRICRCLFHNHSLFQQHMLNKHGILIQNEQAEAGHSCVSSVSRDNFLPKPAHLNSTPVSDKITLNGHSSLSPCQAIKIKTELPWDEPPVLTEISNDVSDVTQAAGSVMGPPDNLDLIDDLQPLDLSKKSHLAGYKLTNRDGTDPGDGSTTDEHDPPTQSQDKTDAKSDVKPCKTGAKFICGACYGRYDTHAELVSHQEDQHPNVTCTYTQLDEEVAKSLLTTPNPIGILNVCSTQLPPVTTSPKRTNKLSCTKCSKTFQCMADLHNHIADCAEPYVPKMMFVYYYPGAKNRHFFLPGAKGEMLKVKKGQKFKRNGSSTKKANNNTNSLSQDTMLEGVGSEDSQNNFSKQNVTGLDELFVDQMLNGKKKRRRNYELLYNPHRHIRRREMAEIIDTPKCFGCNGLFSTISLLERHIPMCRHKDKIQDQASSKEAEPAPEVEEEVDDENAYDPNKHMCIYCQKQFTYFGMFRKHVFDVCPVRGDLVERGEYIDEEWEKEISTRATQPAGIQSRTLSRQSSMSSLNGGESMENGDNSSSAKLPRSTTRGRRRRRGNGWYRGKDKKKDNSNRGGWEKYFVLDETFMGIYNTVARTDEDDDDDEEDDLDDDRDGDKSSLTDTVGYNGDGSMDSTTSLSLAKGKDQEQQNSTEYNGAKDYLEQMQQKKQALFAELTKPIDGNGTGENEPPTLLGLKQRRVPQLEKNAKKPKERCDKHTTVEEKWEKTSPTKKDSAQKAKAKLSSADSLANVKQKLAKKIRENKKMHCNSTNMHDAKTSYKSLKLDKSSVKLQKKSPKKDGAESKSSNQKAKMKSTLKLSVSGQKLMNASKVGASDCETECKTEGISGIHKVKKLKPRIGQLGETSTGSAIVTEEFMSLGEIVSRYMKSSGSPKMFLGRPAKRQLKVENEDYEDHATVDEVINSVAMGQASSGASSTTPIELIDSSDEDEDNMKLSDLAKFNRNIRTGSLSQNGSTLAQSSKKTGVRSKNTSLVNNDKTKIKISALKGVKGLSDNGVGRSFSKYKSPKCIYRKRPCLGNIRQLTKKPSQDTGTIKTMDSVDGGNKVIEASTSSRIRSDSEPTLGLNEFGGKLKECSKKRPRSLESVGTSGVKKNKIEASKEAVKLVDVKTMPKKLRA